MFNLKKSMKNETNYFYGYSHMAIFVSSCKKEETPEIQNDRYTPNEFEYIGMEHNKIMLEAYCFIVENKKFFQGSEPDSNKSKLLNFLLEKVNASDETFAKKTQDYIKGVFYGNNIDSTLISPPIREYLTKSELSYLKKLEKIIFESSLEDNGFLNNISFLEEEIEHDRSLNNENLAKLFCATNVAKYSFIYWRDNINKWEDLGHSKSPGGNILKADVAGAAAGATYAAVVNVLPGAGQVAYGSTIAAISDSASVYQGAVELIDWLF